MLFFRFDSHHKSPQMLVRSPRSECTIRVVLSAFYKNLLPLPIDLNLVLLGQKMTGINLESIG